MKKKEEAEKNRKALEEEINKSLKQNILPKETLEKVIADLKKIGCIILDDSQATENTKESDK